MTEKQKQTGLEGPSMAAIYHNWYERGEKTEASYEEKQAVLSGKSPLPPSSRVIFDVEPQPRGISREDHLYWPTWLIKAFDESGALKHEAKLSNEDTSHDGFVCIQAAQRPEGMWQTSSGYRLLAIFDPLPFTARFEISAYFGDGSIKSETLVIPRVARA